MRNSTAYPLMGNIAREIKKLGRDQSMNIHEYGKRWMVEIYFSDLKRVMGEIVRPRKPEYMINEVGLKVFYYNIMRENTRTYG